MIITPQRIRQLSELVLVLEPLLDKPDCTTRYRDLDGKPLTGFVIAGINAGATIEKAAREFQTGRAGIFVHLEEALRASCDYKLKKFSNTGTLHFLFLTIAVRLRSASLAEALSNFIPVAQEKGSQDGFVQAMSYGWSTSYNKSAWIQNRKELTASATSYYDLQKALRATVDDKTTSHYQVTTQVCEGFPLIREFVEAIDETEGLLPSIEKAYTAIHAKYPEVKVGILADFSAAAMFLYLSYQSPDSCSIM